ncbi:MAG: phage holin [Clostridia bacterium]|nr:phage holin [Clostridia bacterium]
MTNKKKVSPDTIARTIILVIALVNTVLTMSGKNPLPFADDDIYTAVSIIATLAASAWAWWKNNSFTTEAIKADEYLQELKDSKKE